jgi:hypothetical protein
LGGLIRKYAYGGSVDTVPSLLTGGEFVVNPQAVNRLGVPFLDNLNEGRIKAYPNGRWGLGCNDLNVSTRFLKKVQTLGVKINASFKSIS